MVIHIWHCLGHVLFIDDIGVICSESVTHKLFADDMKPYSTIDTNLDSFSLQSSLDHLHQWCCNWQLSVNVDKCHVLHIGKTNHHYSYFLLDFNCMTPVLCLIFNPHMLKVILVTFVLKGEGVKLPPGYLSF